jgi:hypothetical protein
MSKYYVQNKTRVVQTDKRFKYVMAINLNPRAKFKEGIIRCITNRQGDIKIKGYTDRSELYKISGKNLKHFKIGERLKIKNEKEIIKKLTGKNGDFIGLEDPDIWIDPKTNLVHLYFTIPILGKRKNIKNKIHLGHAVGKDLDSLKMTEPVLLASSDGRAKEVSIAPINKKGFRYNLVESKDRKAEVSSSVVRVAIAKDMGKAWKFGEIVFHPKDHNISWIGGHASPGPLFSESFINIGEGKRLGLINGREADKKVGGKTKYGIFSIGLFIYDYQKGKINWVSPKPFIRDSQAKNITFASQFIETEKGKGILYAHVDDSFVRAYDLDAEKIKKMLPTK